MRTCIAGLALGAVASLPSTADAQWREETPGGEWYLHGSFTMTGRFGCGAGFRSPSATCSASGNTATIRNGDAWVTLTFVGGPVEYDAHYTKTNTYVLGRIEKTFGGTGPFVVPATWSSAFTVLSFVGTVGRASWYGLEQGGYLAAAVPTDHWWGGPFGPGSVPAAHIAKYQLVWHHLDTNSGWAWNITTDPNPIIVSGSVSLLAPEPSTYVLLGTGLLTLGGIAAHRRKRSEA